jgi:hypothetical protein
MLPSRRSPRRLSRAGRGGGASGITLFVPHCGKKVVGSAALHNAAEGGVCPACRVRSHLAALSPVSPLTVIPAKAGIHTTERILDSRLRGNDGGKVPAPRVPLSHLPPLMPFPPPPKRAGTPMPAAKSRISPVQHHPQMRCTMLRSVQHPQSYIPTIEQSTGPRP